jgi:hypothetical protein
MSKNEIVQKIQKPPRMYIYREKGKMNALKLTYGAKKTDDKVANTYVSYPNKSKEILR